MFGKEFSVIAPVICAIALLIFGIVNISNKNQDTTIVVDTLTDGNTNTKETISNKKAIAFACESTSLCPDFVSQATCASAEEPVLGGVDFVQYFTDFKLSDGTYNESKIGLLGSNEYQSVYNGYKFNFLTQTNKEIFDQSPISYIPQWGGFCSWGIAAETCPNFPWAKDCLGPSAKGKFMEDPDTYIAQGDERWSGWYGDEKYAYFSTRCYVSTVTSADSIKTPKDVPKNF
eukprot:gene21249-27534_t